MPAALQQPEAGIGAFLYARCQPAFPLAQGGVCIFRGSENPEPLDMAYCDYRITMPWPEVTAETITHANGLRLQFLEPGRRVRVTYTTRTAGRRSTCCRRRSRRSTRAATWSPART